MLASQSQGSIDADIRRFQQNFEPKEWVKGLEPRAGQRRPKFAKHAFFVTSLPENENEKRFFFDFHYKILLNPWMVWIAL